MADKKLCKFNSTRVWSYGPASDPLPAMGVAPAANSQFNYPAYTIETMTHTPVNVRWINDLVDKEGNYLDHLLPIDQTVHWANPPMDCRTGEPRTDCAGRSQEAYKGPVPIVTHVHGAHVGPESDGYPEVIRRPGGCQQPTTYRTGGPPAERCSMMLATGPMTGRWAMPISVTPTASPRPHCGTTITPSA